jgi:hypothetical protein
MSPYWKAVRWPLFLVVVPPALFMIFVAGPRPMVAQITAFSLPLWYGACAAHAGWRVVTRGVGGTRGALGAGIVIACANLVILCGMVGMWILMPWGSTQEVGVVKFVEVLPFFAAFLVAVGAVGGWIGARMAARRVSRAMA